MRRTVKKEDGSTIVELVRFDKAWICSECDREYRIAPVQCKCGATDKVFLEKTLPIEESLRKTYKANCNFIYEGDEIKRDSIISMIEKDKVTKNMIKRNLISEVVISKKEEVKV